MAPAMWRLRYTKGRLATREARSSLIRATRHTCRHDTQHQASKPHRASEPCTTLSKDLQSFSDRASAQTLLPLLPLRQSYPVLYSPSTDNLYRLYIPIKLSLTPTRLLTMPRGTLSSSLGHSPLQAPRSPSDRYYPTIPFSSHIQSFMAPDAN